MDKSFFKDLKDAKNMAVIDPDAAGPSARQMAEIAKVRAQERQMELIAQYRTYLNGAAAAIILQGDGQTAFAHKAEKEGGTITIDAESVYLELFKGLWESMGNTGRFTLEQVVALQNRLEQYGRRKGIEIFRMPIFDKTMNSYHENKAAFFETLRRDVASYFASSLVVAETKQQLFTAAVAAQTTELVVPTVITNAIALEIEGLVKSFGGRAIVVETTEDVVDVFKQLLTKLKG